MMDHNLPPTESIITTHSKIRVLYGMGFSCSKIADIMEISEDDVQEVIDTFIGNVNQMIKDSLLPAMLEGQISKKDAISAYISLCNLDKQSGSQNVQEDIKVSVEFADGL